MNNRVSILVDYSYCKSVSRSHKNKRIVEENKKLFENGGDNNGSD